MGNKIIVSQSTLNMIDSTFEEVTKLKEKANNFAVIAEQKAAEARARYNELLAIEADYKGLLSKSSLTEEEFIKIVRNGGQAEMSTGVVVTLQNSNGNTNEWVVADVNHDGTTGTVDLIAKNLIKDTTKEAYSDYFGESQIYRDSNIRNWLIGTYITGFSTTIQNALKTMIVPTDIGNKIVTTSDKIKLLSMNEVGYTSSDYSDIPSSEGTKYPIFDNGSSDVAKSKRLKYKKDGTPGSYWSRTRCNDSSDGTGLWNVNSEGWININSCYVTTSIGIVPVIRF